MTVCGAMLISLSVFTAANAQGRYANQYSRTDVNGIISALENTSNVFRQNFDSNLDQSSLNGTREEDRLNAIVRNYENSLDRLRRSFDRTNNWWASQNSVRDVINNAQPVNDMMNSLPFARRLERQWANMRRDLNKLADTYDLAGLNGGGWNNGGGNGGWNGGGNGNGGWNGGGAMSAPPSWAVGTFYSTNGAGISMMIDNRGRVTVVNEGQTYYGRYNRGQIFLNNDVSTLSRIGNGIRTFNRNQGQTTDYSRDSYGGGIGGGGGNTGGPTNNPPIWARGQFYSSDGSGISLSIDARGTVTVVNQGQTYYGRYYNGEIVLNNDSSTLSRRGNGIRTYNRNTGQTTDYRRQ